ncbi:MAG: NYN domain-containing protein [Leptospirales bacterium]|nr:NYN domain-containing protein [Leptospirales bacterium]
METNQQRTMDECLILVDNSNVFIEGQKFSARKQNLSMGQDYSWRVDFGALLTEVANGHKIIEAILVGSTPPPNDSLWSAATNAGFEVKTYERSPSGEKVVDTELLASGLKVIYKHPRPSILKLLSGDRDFIPLIRNAYEEKWETELWGFSDSISNELQQMVDRVILLDDIFGVIGKYRLSNPA